MSTLIIPSHDLYYAFLSGAFSVIKEKADLNRINVYPVPDGDTGTNLASTMNAIIEDAVLSDNTTDTLASIADAAMMGARGNSGIIIAQFFYGIFEECKQTQNLTFDELFSGIKKAVPYAYKAIDKPVEGTMITVIKDWAGALVDQDVKQPYLENLKQSLVVADLALERTPLQLKVLRDAKVVDSGAKGFVAFVKGFVEYLYEPNSELLKKMQSKSTHEVFEVIHEEIPTLEMHIPYRFCTEAIIKSNGSDMEQIKIDIHEMGDSCIVAGGADKKRIHIHTNHPDQVFIKLRKYGNIIDQKVDDMIKQQEIVHHRKSNIAIVTDSIADIPVALIEKYQIHWIHLQLLMENSIFLDRLTIQPDSFYQLINELKEYPTSSLPTPKSIKNTLNYLSMYYDRIIVLTVSSGLSGTYSAVKKVAETMSDKVIVIDSKLNSAAQGLLVTEIARHIEMGHTIDQLIEFIQYGIKNTKIYVNLDTLDYMVRSGRVSAMKGLMAKLLHLKPIVSLDDQGKGSIVGKAISRKSSTKKIIHMIKAFEKKENKQIKRFNVVHANAIVEAEGFCEALSEAFDMEPDYITEISTITSMSAGLGAIAVGVEFVEKEI